MKAINFAMEKTGETTLTNGVNMKNILLRAAKDSNGHVSHDEIYVVSIDSVEAQDFITKYSDKYLICCWDPQEKSTTSSWKGFYRVVSCLRPNDWVVEQLIFGIDINRSDINHDLTITLTNEQKDHIRYNTHGYRSKTDYVLSIAGDLTKKYRMWRVSVTKPFHDEGFDSVSKQGHFVYISCPEKFDKYYDVISSSDDNDSWKRELAMQAGMSGGCRAYNDVMC